MTNRISLSAAPSMIFADLERRTIRGLAIPAGEVTADARRIRFAQNSVTFGQHTPLLQYHDVSRPVGKLQHHEWTEKGLEVGFQVSRTQAGDEVLILAADGVVGFSVGVEPAADGGVQVKDGITEVLSAECVEISVTPVPALPGARVSEVHLQEERRPVTVTEAPTQVTEPVAVKLDTSGLGAEIAEAFAKLPQQAQPVPVASVTHEPLPYRLGRNADAKFADDVITMLTGRPGQAEARARFDAALPMLFAVGTADVDELSPQRARGDLYVGPLGVTTPVYNALYAGVVNDNVGFYWPKMATSSGWVGDHTEGVEPDSAAFTTGPGDTVVPRPLSGKCTVVREALDAGGTPQLSNLLASEMSRAWSEGLEARAATYLLGLAGTATHTFTTAAVDVALSSEVERYITGLQFRRGGLRTRTALIHEALFTKLADARDDMGRPLYPIVNPVNANGGVNTEVSAIRVGPLTLIPAWSLGEDDGASVGYSFLLNANDVSVWNSAPRRLDNIDPKISTVSFGLFGYFAAGSTRPGAVIKIAYDPAA